MRRHAWQKRQGLSALALLLQATQAHSGAQLPHLDLLTAGQGPRTLRSRASAHPQSRDLPKAHPNVQEVIILGKDLLNLPF